MPDDPTPSHPRWLLLIHQLPPTPNYLRVKIARRMQRIGAVAIKNTVYVLPAAENTLEDFQWTVREIRSAGGEANLFEARVIEGLNDGEVQQLFSNARDEDYASIVDEAKNLLRAASRKRRDTAGISAALQRLRKRAGEIQGIDFFGATKGQVTTALLEDIAQRLADSPPAAQVAPAETFRGRTWVTRTGVHVDRMASAWLIKRFVDPDATFKFVSGKQYAPSAGEVRFDMFDAELTHDGDRCTFEVLIDRMHLGDRALRAIAEVVHDIDLKDAKFDRPETPGLAVIVASIAMAHHDDGARIGRASQALDDLYVYYTKKGR
ncbi:MAG TPA: chromate resistance protein ChrB domain-containing protein [Thermoanaerobaculia bacterium]|nr:chromate resistance protein ChrB domain-containing protein [Thermoanaerobaculia bacterium]